jgi:UDP-glucose 4-epimerase
MRTLVCGGAGFIGSHLVDRLLADGHEVTIVDDLSHGRHVANDSRLYKLRLTDPDLVGVVRSEAPEVVFQLAAQIDVGASVTYPVWDAESNVLGTVAILEAARQAGTRKVVYASSVAIYGPPVNLPVGEDTPTYPRSPYGVSKLSGELYLRQYHDLYGLQTTALALTNTYGPRQDPHGGGGAVALFAEAMLAGRPTRVYGDGSNLRDYMYVADTVDAFVRAAGPAGDGMRLNIGSGVAVTDLELNRAVAEAVGGAAEPSFAPARPGDLAAMVVDASLAAAVLGWRPRTPLADGVARTVAAFVDEGQHGASVLGGAGRGSVTAWETPPR